MKNRERRKLQAVDGTEGSRMRFIESLPPLTRATPDPQSPSRHFSTQSFSNGSPLSPTHPPPINTQPGHLHGVFESLPLLSFLLLAGCAAAAAAVAVDMPCTPQCQTIVVHPRRQLSCGFLLLFLSSFLPSLTSFFSLFLFLSHLLVSLHSFFLLRS